MVLEQYIKWLDVEDEHFDVSISGFPMEIKTTIRYLIICGYHIFTL